MKTVIFALLLFFTSSFVLAPDVMGSFQTPSNEIFLGAGEALSFPASIRYRRNDIEGVYMGPGLLGAAKVFKNPYYPALYTEFGMGLITSPPTSAGFFGSSGGSWKIFWGLRFRCELYIVGGLNSYVKGGALVGLSIVF